jgi:hypothetical protein
MRTPDYYQTAQWLWLADDLGLHIDVLMDVTALAGIVFSLFATVFVFVSMLLLNSVHSRFLILRRARCKVVFAVLWLAYMSLYSVGSTFLHFQAGESLLFFASLTLQWDILLLEAGFLGILASPLFYRTVSSADSFLDPGVLIARRHNCLCQQPPEVPIYMVKWLAFRLMYQAGVVKLTRQWLFVLYSAHVTRLTVAALHGGI